LLYRAKKRNAAKLEKEHAFTLEYFLCLASFFMLLLNSLFGMWAIIAFIAPWLVIGLRQAKNVKRALLANWQLLLLPALTTLSVMWSDDPMWTLKASAEVVVTMVIGIMAGSCIKPRVLISALMSAFFIIACQCIFVIGQIAAAEEDAPTSGIFQSKNYFSCMMSIFMLVSFSVLLDKGQAKVFRVAAAIAVITTPVLVFLGHSLGAVLAVLFTLAVFFAARSLKNVPRSIRILIYGFLFLVFSLVIITPILTEADPVKLLNLLGKDSTLTGRTFLWRHAIDNIARRPILGIGYGAFWRIQNPEAQELWYALNVPAGAGFSFHNEYLQMFVDLGICGFMLLVSYLFVMSRNAFRLVFKPVRPEQAFTLIMFTFYMLRTPVEMGLVGQFDIGMVMLCVLWIYLKPISPEKPQYRHWGNIYRSLGTDVITS
jgi:exopolysaccharide production protein ExoQ